MTAAADSTPESNIHEPVVDEPIAGATASVEGAVADDDIQELVDEALADEAIIDEALVAEAVLDEVIDEAVIAEAILDEVIDEAVAEEAVLDEVIDEALAAEAILDDAIAEATAGEAPDDEGIEDALVAEAVLDEVIAEAVAEEAVLDEVIAEAVAAEAVLDEVIAEADAEEAILDEVIAEAAVDEAIVEAAIEDALSEAAVAVEIAVKAFPTPAAPPRAKVATTATVPSEPWGRVEEDGTVSVREADGWRVVGQYPDGSPEEALAYFERKYADLASEVGLLEVRQHRGGASANDLRSAARAVSAKLDNAAAVGDLASLTARVAAVTETLAAASETEAAAAREAVGDAVRVRTELVEKIEAIAARDPRSVQWKQASAEVSALFDEWQSQQQNGPRLPKSTAQQLWKRFRDARATFDKHRRDFYAELDEAHKGVRDRKTRLVEKAEGLAGKGEDGIPAYRELLDEWKTAGRAGKKVDDALWARFKAAGDALYGARIERETADAEASREKIEAKRALLEEARAVADEREITKARTMLTAIQRQWDEIGRIFPREAERTLDDDLRKIEQALRTREETDWKRNNPETKARANDMTRQLMDAIEKLEDELAAAEKTGDKASIAKAAEALEARRSWLKALGG